MNFMTMKSTTRYSFMVIDFQNVAYERNNFDFVVDAIGQSTCLLMWNNHKHYL